MKLQRIQNRLHAPKDQYNSFGGYNYRSCESILKAVKPILEDEGCTLILSDQMELVGERYYIKATATLTDGEKAWSASAYARESDTKKGMDASQITGTASSYARKYALNGLFLIDDTKDFDTNGAALQSKEASDHQKTDLRKRAQEAGVDLGSLCKEYGITEGLTVGQYYTLKGRLDEEMEKKVAAYSD